MLIKEECPADIVWIVIAPTRLLTPIANARPGAKGVSRLRPVHDQIDRRPTLTKVVECGDQLRSVADRVGCERQRLAILLPLVASGVAHHEHRAIERAGRPAQLTPWRVGYRGDQAFERDGVGLTDFVVRAVRLLDNL